MKGPGSTWFPDSPTVRLDILDKGGLNLALQGFLASALDPNDDSLSVWLEVLGAPDTLAAGTAFDVDFRVEHRLAREHPRNHSPARFFSGRKKQCFRMEFC